MAVVAVVSQTPGRGWRWSTQEASVVIDQGVAYHDTAALATAEAERVLGSVWPGSPSEDFATVDDAEEDGWHYVGEAGEPAFETYDHDADSGTPEVPAWANVGTPWPAMAFRLRETGVVDIVGVVERLGAATAIVFTLPVGYRPNEQAFFPYYIHDTATPAHKIGIVVVNAAGNVTLGGSSVAVGDFVYISGSIFLDTAAP